VNWIGQINPEVKIKSFEWIKNTNKILVLSIYSLYLSIFDLSASTSTNVFNLHKSDQPYSISSDKKSIVILREDNEKLQAYFYSL
jgi:hypothetical protein